MTSLQHYPYYELIDSDPKSAAFDPSAAYEFLRKHSNALNDVRLAHWRGEVDDFAFWEVLAQYQGAEGGFANGLDPDYQGKFASIHSTIEALRIMVTHQQYEAEQVQNVQQFLRQTAQNDGTWQELPEVLNDPLCPKWYQPGEYRIYETALIAGYGLELGFSEFWASAVRYVRQAWPELPFAESAHPYWATLLLLGRSPANIDRSIALDALDNLGIFIRKRRIDPYDCSTIVEILDSLDDPEVDDLLLRTLQMLGAAQSKEDGGIMTAYGKQLRPSATFNALMAMALMMQRGIVS